MLLAELDEPVATMLADMAQVLVVEDEEDIAFPLVRTLEREGYEVTWVDPAVARRSRTSHRRRPTS